MKSTLGIIAIVIGLIVLVGIGPVFTIWSINLLFGLTVPITIWTWLSTAWLTAIIASIKLKAN